MSESTDRIERSIHIHADADRVWGLISEPGWWINDGTIAEHRIESSGDVHTVHDPTHGAFRITTLRLDSPNYASFGWGGGEDKSAEAHTNLIEFWIDEHPDGGVLLRVIESGFDSMNVSERQRRASFEDSSEGWQTELAAAQTLLSQRDDEQ
ncbi:MAG: ATPase [Ornithinimicrobium sp.]